MERFKNEKREIDTSSKNLDEPSGIDEISDPSTNTKSTQDDSQKDIPSDESNPEESSNQVLDNSSGLDKEKGNSVDNDLNQKELDPDMEENELDSNENEGDKSIDEFGGESKEFEEPQKIENNARLKRQQNINSLRGGYYESANIVNHTHTHTPTNNANANSSVIINNIPNPGESNDAKIIDPSREYPMESISRVVYKIDVNRILQGISKERIVFVTCPNDQMVNDTACILFRKLNQKDDSLECRILAPVEEKEKEICQSIENLFSNQLCKIGKGKDVFLIIDEVDTVFFDSFRKITLGRLNHIIGKAEKYNVFVVVLIHKRKQIDALVDIQITRLKVYDIHFLEVLLKFHGIENLSKKITNQKKYGLWGRNDEEFYNWISGFLKEGKERLQKEVRIREQFKEGDDLHDFISQHIVKINIDEILTISPVSIYVAFIATYLPELSLNRLEEILLLLLDGEAPFLKEIDTINAKGKKVVVEKKFDLLDIWSDPISGGDRILYDSKIRFFEDEDGVEYYSFSEPYLSKSFKEYFKNQKRRFLHNTFKKILVSGIFFDPETKGSFLDSLVILSLKMMVKNPAEFGMKRMLNIFYETHYLEDQISREDNLFNKVIKSYKKHHVLNRLCLLLVEMLKKQKLKQLVDEMLIAQISIGQHVVVFDVIKKLHNSPDFDSLFWLRRLIDNGTNQVRKEAYVRLIRLAAEKPDHIENFLSQLSSWHPGEKEENLSPSNHASLAFIIDFTFEVGCETPGEYPVTYPLFANSTTQKLNPLANQTIDWLFHPNIEQSVNKIKSLFGHRPVKLETVQSDIIEYWYMMICGKTMDPLDECLRLFKAILLELDKRLEASQKKVIFISMQKRISRILNWLEDVDGYSPIGMHEFQEKKEALESGQLLYQVEEYIANLFYKTLLENN